MTVTDQIKILDRKIVQNEAQYDLDRKVAKISALPSNNLDKYEYLTYEDLGLKLSTVEQAKFEYSPVGKIFNKGLDKDKDKKEGLLKRLKNIEGKNEEQLKAVKDQNKIQTRLISGNKIKPTPLKSIYSKEVKDDININNDEAKKYLKYWKTWRVIKFTTLNWFTSQVIISILTLIGLDGSSICLKLINGNIGINVVKLNIEEFRNEIDKLEKKENKERVI